MLSLADQPYLSLYELTLRIKNALQENFAERVWIKAEIHKLNYYPHSGHCYPDLVEKREDTIVAEMRGLLWSNNYRRINMAFQRLTGEPLRDGLKVLCLVQVTFDPRRGIALVIHDIDPSYTLGDLEREKQQTIERLKREGWFDRNRQLPIPLLPKRIAIISALTSRGYADFMNVIQQKKDQYHFICKLFPAWLQGEKAVASIVAQLRYIKQFQDTFDVVAIIRGGGGETGLSAFNEYALAREVAQFPLPVLTGIGHATNETVAEMVACVNCITPTKLAEFLIERFDAFAEAIFQAEETIVQFARTQLQAHHQQLRQTGKQLQTYAIYDLRQHHQQLSYEQKALQKAWMHSIQKYQTAMLMFAYTIAKASKHLLHQHQQNITQWPIALRKNIKQYLSHLHQQIDISEKQMHWFHPGNMLKIGFSITLHNGKPVKSAAELEKDDEMITRFADGEVQSHVLRVQHSQL